MKGKKLKIIEFGNPLLREKAKPVTVFHKKLNLLVDSIAETLYASEDGAALAATQVAEMKRITVIDYENEYFEMVNPEILESSGEQVDKEGCLSFPGYYGMVKRFETVKLKYQDRSGGEHIIERSGKMARCIQHELDHLDGILFIDRMVEDTLVHSITKEKISLEHALKIANGEMQNAAALQ